MKQGHENSENNILIDWKTLYSQPVPTLTINFVKQKENTEV